MKKIIISLALLIVLLLASALVWDLSPIWAEALGTRHEYFDALAAALFMSAIVPSCYFEEGRKELNAQDNA